MGRAGVGRSVLPEGGDLPREQYLFGARASARARTVWDRVPRDGLATGEHPRAVVRGVDRAADCAPDGDFRDAGVVHFGLPAPEKWHVAGFGLLALVFFAMVYR